MSYLVLARKWRPQTFAEVIGQDHVTLTLLKAVEKERLAHAYLFAGPRGCGKTTTARLLAKVINCEMRKGAEPCNECGSCLAVIEGRHLDVFEIDGASNRGIDEIRDLREKIGYAPAQGRSKIYIIDEVHMLTPQAFNALLKTLEEPPKHVYLVFATTEPHKVPATILSRCQRFNFKRLELGEIVGQLEKICAKEKIACDHEALILIGRRAEGSMRDAESLLDQCISASDDRIDLGLVRSVLGLVDSHIISELLLAIGDRDVGKALSIVDGVVAGGLDLDKFFLAFIEGLRNLIVLGVEGVDWLDLTSDEIEGMRRISARFTIEDLLCLFRQASRAFREFKNSSQPRYYLEAAIAEAASWESAVELSDLIRKIDGPGGTGIVPGAGRSEADRKKGSGKAGESDDRAAGAEMPGAPGFGYTRGIKEEMRDAGGIQPVDKAPETAGAYAKVDRSPGSAVSGGKEEGFEGPVDREGWERFLSKIRESKLTLGIWLVSAEFRGVKGGKLLLRFSYQNRFAREMVLENKNRRYIETQLERFFGKELVIAMDESGTDAEAEESARKAPESRGGEESAMDAPDMVRKIAETFDGELNEIERS
jgi:DNA polymerase-3 subunit gamma/tau